MNCGADAHDDGATKDGLPPAKLVASPQCGQSTKHASNFVDGDNDTLHFRIESRLIGSQGFVDRVHLREYFDEGGKSEQAAHNPLVITEQDETNACQRRNGMVKALAFETKELLHLQDGGGWSRFGAQDLG